MNPNEISIIKCKICLETKTRILSGKYPDGKNNRWVDESGLEFNGKTCPTCHKIKMAERKRNKGTTNVEET